MRLSPFLIPALVTTLGACDEFPQLDYVEDSAAQNAAYVDLVPIETLTSGIPEEQITPETEEDLEARVKRLKTRSNRLKGAVVDDATQDRMRTGIKPVTE